jgi:hypothetical protein
MMLMSARQAIAARNANQNGDAIPHPVWAGGWSAAHKLFKFD